MHPIGRIALASHALPVAALALPLPAWPLLAGWGAVQAAVMWELLRPSSDRLAPNVRRAEGETSRVALTFDDGPFGDETDRLLDRLDEAGVKASFFLVGRRARAHPALVRRIRSAGHTLGNHTLTHPKRWSVMTRKGVLDEVAGAQSAIADACGDAPRWFRPPVGHKNFHLGEALLAHGLAQVTWSLRSFDTLLRDRDRVTRRVLPRARGGDIILLHEGLAGRGRGDPLAPETLPPLLEGLARSGLSPVSLQSLLCTPPAARPRRTEDSPRTTGSDAPCR
jgi:peptidoglycan/xylan/chitin deacetylase (PgdA/CDA1 family)